MAIHKKIRLLCLILAGLMLMGGCKNADEPQPSRVSFGGLVCLEYSRYTGVFPEDGSNRQVKDVAAMLVLNSSDQFLDYATITCAVGAHTGTFKVTGLPPGSTAWVLEKDGLVLSEGEHFLAEQCDDYYFNPNAVMLTDALSVKSDGNTLTVTNDSDKTLHNVAIYYKTVHSDGNFFGGITYLLDFGTLAPGESATKMSAYYGENSKIVRYSFRENSA